MWKLLAKIRKNVGNVKRKIDTALRRSTGSKIIPKGGLREKIEITCLPVALYSP